MLIKGRNEPCNIVSVFEVVTGETARLTVSPRPESVGLLVWLSYTNPVLSLQVPCTSCSWHVLTHLMPDQTRASVCNTALWSCHMATAWTHTCIALHESIPRLLIALIVHLVARGLKSWSGLQVIDMSKTQRHLLMTSLLTPWGCTFSSKQCELQLSMFWRWARQVWRIIQAFRSTVLHTGALIYGHYRKCTVMLPAQQAACAPEILMTPIVLCWASSKVLPDTSVTSHAKRLIRTSLNRKIE